MSEGLRNIAGKRAPQRFGSLQAKPPLSGPGQRIGLLGGSFNPPHDAHVLISEIARARLGLDAVWWIVSPGNPLKSHDELLPQSERIAFSRAIAPQTWIKVTAFEADLPTAFTAATIAFLNHRFPDRRFVWLMGADNLVSFHRWQDWRSIAHSVPIAVVDRPGHRLKAMAAPSGLSYRRSFVPERLAATLPNRKPPAWTLLTGQLSDLSSTAIRETKRQQTAK
ncbi:MAG: nicotinate-nucleotide adenylyltransferase [Pseudomonadota bacterium]